MKKQIYLAAALLTIIMSATSLTNAQNWLLTGNGTVKTTDFLGTTKNNPLVFKTSAVERMRIVPTTGFIGIGTTNPLSPLDLLNSTQLKSLNIKHSLNTANLNMAYYSTASNIDSGATYGFFSDIPTTSIGNGFQGSYYGKVAGSGTGNHYGLFAQLTGTGAGKQYGCYSDISNSGNGEHAGYYASLTGAGTGNQYGARISITNSGTGYHYGFYSVLSGSNAIRKFGVYSSVPSSTNDYAFYGIGRSYFSDNVGIGVTQPTAKLHVSSSSENKTASFTNDYSGTSTKYGIYNEVSKEGSGNKFGIYSTATDNGSSDAIGIRGEASGSNISGSGGKNYGVHGVANAGYNTTGYGVYGQSESKLGSTAYGVYSSASGNGTNYGVYSTTTQASTTASTSVFGIRSLLTNAGTGTSWGIYSEASNTSNADAYGIYAKASSTGDQNKRYGVYGVANGGGTLSKNYGVYGYASGSNVNYAGYFNGLTYTDELRIGDEVPVEGYIVSVDGKIICEELRVQNKSDWPDYVFEDNYKLPSLEEVEQHIKDKKHLPGIPSANEVEEGGLLIGEMQKKMMEKIEELTLYLIELKKENKQLKVEMNILKGLK